MFIKIGDKIRCHNTGRLIESGRFFCVKGKDYPVIAIYLYEQGVENSISIVNEDNLKHSFSVKNLYKWFETKGRNIILEKSNYSKSIQKMKERYKYSYFLI